MSARDAGAVCAVAFGFQFQQKVLDLAAGALGLVVVENNVEVRISVFGIDSIRQPEFDIDKEDLCAVGVARPIFLNGVKLGVT